MEVNDAKEMSVRKYEDMDQEFVLGSGLQCPVAEVPPPLPPRKHEDADPDGQNIIVLGSGLQCPVFEEPPPLPPRKYEDTDPHGDPVFVLSSESHHDMRDRENENVGGRNDKSDRKYEDGDLAGETIFVLGQGLHRAAPSELPARRSENKQESSTDHTSDTPEGTGGKEQDSPGFCHDVRGTTPKQPAQIDWQSRADAAAKTPNPLYVSSADDADQSILGRCMTALRRYRPCLLRLVAMAVIAAALCGAGACLAMYIIGSPITTTDISSSEAVCREE
ncbi:hypothetical protein Bbelb_317640 [Branchiostoma belcheri]|nr:hypothetical protein Bbelb_317640 [Branchiostoma belcheri]